MRTIDETTEFTGETPSRLDGSGLSKGGWPFASALCYFGGLSHRQSFISNLPSHALCLISGSRLPESHFVARP